MKFEEKLNQIDVLQAKINSYGKFPIEIKKKIDYKFRLDWNYYSNAMEGGTLTKEETREVMMGNIEVHKGKPFKDFREMQGHDEVVLDIMNIGKGVKRLSEAKIKGIHKAIMFEPDPEERKKIGKWKTEANEIINYKGEKFEFAPPNEVAELMHELLNVTNAGIDAIKLNKKNAPHPAWIAFQFHNKYVRIHPFYDGNGRTARIFTNLILISSGYPPIIIKDTERDRYNQILADIQGYGAPEGLFYNFLADRLIDSMNLVLSALEGKDIEEPDDLTKEIEILKRKQNPPPVKIKKSKTEIVNVIDKEYIPLLDEVNSKLLKFAPLFKNSYWGYFDEPDSEGKTPTAPKAWDLSRIQAYFRFTAQRTGSSVHFYKAMFWLMDYKDEKKFSLEVSFRLYCFDDGHHIEVFIGQPFRSSRFAELISNVSKLIMKANEYPEVPEETFHKYDLPELGYGSYLSESEIKQEADKIARLVLKLIKENTEKQSG